MTQEGSTNEIRTKAHNDVRVRSYFAGCISHELEAAYMHQVSKFPILTQEEEIKWTTQHYECRQRIHAIIDEFPLLIMSVLNSLLITQNNLKLEHYFNFGGQSEERNEQSQDDKSDQSLKERFCKLVLDITNKYAPTFSQGDAGASSKLSAFVKAFLQLAPKNTFYQLCLDKLMDESVNAYFVPQEKWVQLKPEIEQLTSQMNEASKTLIEHNLRLVISIAGHYAGTSISLADLVQEGNIGLMRAVDKFDHKLGHRFTTYASYWIRQAITKYITNHSRIIRMPANTVAQIASIKQAEQRYLTETGQVPSPEKLAALVKLPTAKIVALQKMVQQPLSLHAMIDDSNTLEDNIADPNTRPPDVVLDLQNIRSSLDELMSLLDERERTIIQLNFGLRDGKCLTLSEISKKMGISSERVRQIKTLALQKMRLSDMQNPLDGL